jgi:hypothetical protein
MLVARNPATCGFQAVQAGFGGQPQNTRSILSYLHLGCPRTAPNPLLSYHGNAHEPGNIFIQAPAQKTLMVVDIAEFITDLKNAAEHALACVTPGQGMDPRDRANPWALFYNYTDRVMVQCVNTLSPHWSTRLAAFDALIWDQCYAMEQSLRGD